MPRSYLHSFGRIAAVAFATAVTGCSSGATPNPSDTVASISVTGISQPLLVGANGQAVATASDASGAVVTASFTWTSSSLAVATVTSGGAVTAVSAGTTTISAASGGKTGNLVVTVSNPPVATITVTGLAQQLTVGANVQATATAMDANGGMLTPTFTWTTSNATIATVGSDGTVAAITAGNVTITASAGGKSGSQTVTVNNGLPVVTAVSPASVTAGATTQTLTVLGSGFVATSVVQWNGATLATTFGSTARLTAQLPASNVAVAAAAQVTVFSPAPGGGESSAQTFTVSAVGTNPVPAITALSPTSAAIGGAAFPLTVTGTNFIASSTVQWNGSSRPTTFVSATQLVAQIGAGDIASATTAAVTVVTPAPGGGTAAARSFTVFTALPVLTYSQLPVAFSAQIDSQVTAEAQTAAINITSPGLPSGNSASFAVMPLISAHRGIAAASRVGGAPSRSQDASFRSGDCPIITPAEPPVNLAGLPLNEVTYTFTLANCTEDALTTQSGLVTLTATNPGSSELSYNIAAVNYDGRIGDSTGTVNLLVNAVDSVRNPIAGTVNEWVTETQTLDETGDQFGHVVDTLSLHTVYTYSPSAGQLVYNVTMFPGTIVVDQTAVYVVAPGNNFGVSGTFTVVTSTITPLQFDPTCHADVQFTAGVLQSVVAGHITTTTYRGCNTPPTIQ
jgi:hypothetical protein